MVNLNEEKIKTAKAKMEQLWICKGMIDEEVVAASIEVDILMNEYQQNARKQK